MIQTSRPPSPPTDAERSARRPPAGASGPEDDFAGRAASRRPAREALAGLGFAALIGATAWKAASVSIWLAPAYLALLALIFAAPRAARLWPRGRTGHPRPGTFAPDDGDANAETNADAKAFAHVDAGPNADVGAETGPDADGPPADGDDLHSNGPGPSRRPSKGKARPDPGTPAETGPARPRRKRARSRKAAPSAAMPEPGATAPVTWVRLGPGKFVRGDLVDAPATGQGEDEVEGNGLSNRGPSQPWAETETTTATATIASTETEAEIAAPTDIETRTETETETDAETTTETETFVNSETSTAPAPAGPSADARPPRDAPDDDADAARPAPAAEHGIAPSAFSVAGRTPRPVLERSEVDWSAVDAPARREAEPAVDVLDYANVDVKVVAPAPIDAEAEVPVDVDVEAAIDVDVNVQANVVADVEAQARETDETKVVEIEAVVRARRGHDRDRDRHRNRARARAVLGRAALAARGRSRAPIGPRSPSGRAARRGHDHQTDRTRRPRHCRSPPRGRAGARRWPFRPRNASNE